MRLGVCWVVWVGKRATRRATSEPAQGLAGTKGAEPSSTGDGGGAMRWRQRRAGRGHRRRALSR